MRAAFILGTICVLSGCGLNRAVIDPASFAPEGPCTPWIPLCMPKPQCTSALCNESPPTDIELTLGEFLNIAMRNNAETKISWAQAYEAAGKYGQSESYLFPTINAVPSWQRTRAGSFANNQVKIAQGRSWGPQFTLSYLLFDFGQNLQTSEASRWALFLANWTHNRVMQTLVQQTVSDFYNYLYQVALQESLNADLVNALTTVVASEARLKAGVQDIADYLQAKSQYLDTKTKQIAQQQAVKNSYAALLKDAGLPADMNLKFAQLPADVDASPILTDLEVLVEEARVKRYDLLAARADLESQTHTVESVRLSNLPTINYNLNIGSTYFPGGHNDRIDYTSQIGLSFPLFSGFSQRNKLKTAQAVKERSTATLLQKELQVVLDVTTALYKVNTVVESLKATKEFLEVAEKQYDVVSKKYKEGTNTILDMLFAQTSLADARARRVNSLQQWFTSLANLAYATGDIAIPPMSEVCGDTR